ncbi:MAG: thiolase domain-containing protein [Candidatus Thermoplasmatota archaeon]|nr:thiolase domain-containing protein [Euryarchaeota archaeon]MBU4031783.1 thiolase domain-containing protein [Candidatus Thermoplasmatota archaeon]MBU4071698.1 thiolase domain-containing protein [Candidatus Thermoplasmatota archaeon]MBU4143777.1 thiolase domain-containing protein [Candidatus Thermoplasmatota archaeon]MBU4591389.1 thiolase domain-containing protein [Candidatus Thermoplasmatota archaeon]
MREVAIIGIGETKFGELWERSLRDLGIEAGFKAMGDAGISGNEIDAIFLGNMSAGQLIDQEHIAPLIADYSGMAEKNIPAIRIEAASASGGLALSQGYMAVASGVHDIVVVGGAEKMTDVGDDAANEIMAKTADQEWEAVFGATLGSLYAMMARRHMNEFGTTKEQLASVAVKNHLNGSMNPHAQFRSPIKLEAVLRAPMVASPLGTFDFAPLSDGAAAVILAPLDIAHKYSDTPIKILSCGQAGDYMALHDRKSITRMDATVVAGKKAFKYAGIQPKDVNLAEVHDCTTISEIMAIEDLGFFKKGQGGKVTEDGSTALNSKISINTSGGLKAKGYPVGASGVSQAIEAVTQLRGEAGQRQVSKAEIALLHNIGGTGSSAIVHLLGRC